MLNILARIQWRVQPLALFAILRGRMSRLSSALLTEKIGGQVEVHTLEDVMNVIEIAFTGYPVTDFQRVRQFYQAVLGLKEPRFSSSENRMKTEYSSISPGSLLRRGSQEA